MSTKLIHWSSKNTQPDRPFRRCWWLSGCSQLTQRIEHLAQLHKGPHHINPYLHRLGASQHIGRLNRPVLGERKRQQLGEFGFAEVVTVCDPLGLLFGRELKQEVGWKALLVALDLLIQALSGHTIQLGQISIDHHS